MYAIADRGGSGYKITTLRLYTIAGVFRLQRERQRANIVYTEIKAGDGQPTRIYKETRRAAIINLTFEQWSYYGNRSNSIQEDRRYQENPI